MMTKRKKKNRKLFLLVLALICLAIMVFAGIRWWLYHQAAAIHYPAFDIPIPRNYEIHGIDVSRYQELVAWDQVKAMEDQGVQLGFVFIKATEGVRNRDVQFKRNWRRARQAGMIRGAYHFFITTKDAKAQAENFINQVKLEKWDLPPVLDVEVTYGVEKAKIREEVKEWLTIVEEHYGVRPLLYTNIDFYNKILGKDFDEYPLWIAHYKQEGKPRIERDWLFWQHSEEGRVNGIRNKVDFNVFNGDSSAFVQLLVD